MGGGVGGGDGGAPVGGVGGDGDGVDGVYVALWLPLLVVVRGYGEHAADKPAVGCVGSINDADFDLSHNIHIVFFRFSSPETTMSSLSTTGRFTNGTMRNPNAMVYMFLGRDYYF